MCQLGGLCKNKYIKKYIYRPSIIKTLEVFIWYVIIVPFRYEKVHQPLYKVADESFHIQGEDIL